MKVENDWIRADGSMTEREEREMFPEVYAAAGRAKRLERESFKMRGRYVSYDEALETELVKIV